MKIRFASTNRFEKEIEYSFDGQKITAKFQDQTETIDFSGLSDGESAAHSGVFSSPWLRWAKKEDGEVYLVLYQSVGAGHWQHYSDWMDSSNYSGSCNLKKLDEKDTKDYGDIMQYPGDE